MDDNLPPLGDNAKDALSAEMRRPEEPDAMRARVLAGVLAAVAVTAATTATAATANAAAGSAGTATGGAATGTAATAAGTAAKLGLTAKVIPWIVVAFAAGGGVGATVQSRISAPPSVPSASLAPPVTVAPSAIAERSPAPPWSAAPSSIPSASMSAPPPKREPPASGSASNGASGSDADLGAERALVERARSALGRGQNDGALEALDAHAKRFPSGRLAEEREALAVQALAKEGRTAEARARAAKFRARYPNSVFSSVIDAISPLP